MCFFAGGTRFSEQGFGISSYFIGIGAVLLADVVLTFIILGATQLNSSLLTLSVIGVLLPAAFHAAVQPSVSDPTDPLTNTEEGKDILSISRGVRFVMPFCQLQNPDHVFVLIAHSSGCDCPVVQ